MYLHHFVLQIHNSPFANLGIFGIEARTSRCKPYPRSVKHNFCNEVLDSEPSLGYFHKGPLNNCMFYLLTALLSQ